MPMFDQDTANRIIAIGQSIRDEHRVKPSILYDGARKPIPVRVGKPLSRNQRRILRSK